MPTWSLAVICHRTGQRPIQDCFYCSLSAMADYVDVQMARWFMSWAVFGITLRDSDPNEHSDRRANGIPRKEAIDTFTRQRMGDTGGKVVDTVLYQSTTGGQARSSVC